MACTARSGGAYFSLFMGLLLVPIPCNETCVVCKVNHALLYVSRKYYDNGIMEYYDISVLTYEMVLLHLFTVTYL